MKRLGLFLISMTITILVNGQTIKIQAGTSISNLDWKYKGINVDPVYKETLIGYSFFTGMDYFDKQYFNLSSNIGMIRKGGKGEIALIDQNGELAGQTIIEKPTLDYLSINTTVDLKYPIKEKVFPFICFGPRLDYLFNNSKHFDGLKDLNELNNTTIGLILGCGLKYYISNIQLGLRADYYLNFTKVADWTIQNSGIGGEINVNTFTTNLTIGYKLK
jgi:hypothetical protein